MSLLDVITLIIVNALTFSIYINFITSHKKIKFIFAILIIIFKYNIYDIIYYYL